MPQSTRTQNDDIRVVPSKQTAQVRAQSNGTPASPYMKPMIVTQHHPATSQQPVRQSNIVGAGHPQIDNYSGAQMHAQFGSKHVDSYDQRRISNQRKLFPNGQLKGGTLPSKLTRQQIQEVNQNLPIVSKHATQQLNQQQAP